LNGLVSRNQVGFLASYRFYSITTQVACAVVTVISTLNNIHNASENDVICGLWGKMHISSVSEVVESQNLAHIFCLFKSKNNLKYRV